MTFNFRQGRLKKNLKRHQLFCGEKNQYNSSPGHSSFQVKMVSNQGQDDMNQEVKDHYLSHGMSQSYCGCFKVKEGSIKLPAVTPNRTGKRGAPVPCPFPFIVQ